MEESRTLTMEHLLSGRMDELRLAALEDMVNLVRTFPDVHNAEVDCVAFRRVQEQVEEPLAAWRAKQSEIRSRNAGLQQEIAAAERRLVTAKIDGSCGETLELLKEELARAQAREKQIQLDTKDVEDHIEALNEQLLAIKLQKETLEYPDQDEAHLKNELSLFLNVSSILPDLGEPKFKGTFVDKQKGAKTFNFSETNMSQFQICQAAWDMMR